MIDCASGSSRSLLRAARSFETRWSDSGHAEIGAAWSKQSQEGRDYLSVKLDDPSFVAPIYANLFAEDDGENFSLIWTRSRKVNGE